MWQKVAKSGKKWQKVAKKSAKIGQKVANFVPNGRIIKRQFFWPFCPDFDPPRGGQKHLIYDVFEHDL